MSATSRAASSVGKASAEHPRVLVVRGHSRVHEIFGSGVPDFIAKLRDLAARSTNCFVVLEQTTYLTVGVICRSADVEGRTLSQVTHRALCKIAERADSLCHLVNGRKQLLKMGLEQGVQARELRATDIPVEAVRSHQKHVCVGQNAAER